MVLSIFSSTYWHLYIFFEKCVSDPLPILKLDICLFIGELQECFIYCGYKSLIRYMIYKYFLSLCWLPFHFLESFSWSTGNLSVSFFCSLYFWSPSWETIAWSTVMTFCAYVFFYEFCGFSSHWRFDPAGVNCTWSEGVHFILPVEIHSHQHACHSFPVDLSWPPRPDACLHMCMFVSILSVLFHWSICPLDLDFCAQVPRRSKYPQGRSGLASGNFPSLCRSRIYPSIWPGSSSLCCHSSVLLRCCFNYFMQHFSLFTARVLKI